MKVEYYIAENGAAPVIEWLERLKDKRLRARIDLRLRSVELGNLGDTKPVGDGVYELRIHAGPGYRVYFGFRNQDVILLLCGGTKVRNEKTLPKPKSIGTNFN